MKPRNFLLTCLVITAGALYGRYWYLSKEVFLPPNCGFLAYLQSCVTGSPPAAQPDAGRVPPAVHTAAAPEAAPAPHPAVSRETAPPAPPAVPRDTAPAAAGAAVAAARQALEAGNVDGCLRALSSVRTQEADDLRTHALYLREMVKDVAVDPAAGKATLLEVRLTNSNVLHAVEARNTPQGWELTLDTGIGCTLPADQVAAAPRRVNAESFHRSRRAQVQSRLDELEEGGVLQRWRGIRLAWRRGFPDMAYQRFASLASVPQALEVLGMVLPPEAAAELAQALVPAQPATPEQGPPDVAAAAGSREVMPSPASRWSPVLGDGAPEFAAIDAKIREARGHIYGAMQKEGAAAADLLRAAAKLLNEARRDLTSDPGYPRGPQFDQRVHEVTLLLNNVVKGSGFGL